ncbi:MAG TPA: VOC family protein [Candidatus Binatia bacterium]|jgi:catechol 2,3-dioxygenase-like lactoylglutathione lyase family enzyme
MIKLGSLFETHMECRSLAESGRVLTDLLAFERVGEGPSEATFKHPNTEWRLIVHEAPDAPTKQMHNHWGVRVRSNAEVDKAYEYLTSHKDEYKISQIGKPLWNHGSYSCYFLEPGTNGWEIECYEAVMRKPATAEKVGGIRMPHWDQPLPEDKFSGRGYVPQAFTHGTLVANDIKVNWDFYVKVLGLEVHQANDHVIYVKHPNARTYIVCAERKDFKVFSPNFRNTVTVESRPAVKQAYDQFRETGRELGVTELLPLTEENGRISFCFRDPGTNCWEIAALNEAFKD